MAQTSTEAFAMFDAEVDRYLAWPPFAALGSFRVGALARGATHGFAKATCDAFDLLAGLGVDGDAHCGVLDQHLHLGKPDAPANLRQLHLFPGELMDLLRAEGFAIAPGAIGENVVTRGFDLLDLPLGAVIRFPSGAEARLTGRRTPCRLVDRLGKGLMRRLMGDAGWGGRPIAGVMAVVDVGGRVRVGDEALLIGPPGAQLPLPAL